MKLHALLQTAHAFAMLILISIPTLSLASLETKGARPTSPSSKNDLGKYVWISRHISNQKCVEIQDDGSSRQLDMDEAKKSCPPLREYANSLRYDWNRAGDCREFANGVESRTVHDIYCGGRKKEWSKAGVCGEYSLAGAFRRELSPGECGTDWMVGDFGACFEVTKTDPAIALREVSKMYCDKTPKSPRAFSDPSKSVTF